MRSLDTNIILRFLLQDHHKQSPAITAMLAGARPNSFAVADVVLFECVWILQGASYQFARPLIAATLEKIMAVGQINCNRAMLRLAIPRYLKHKHMSFVDACLATYAELNRATPLLTFDKNLSKALPELTEEIQL